MAPFFVIVFPSEIQATSVRLNFWQQFRTVGLFVSEDLTPTEQDFRWRIIGLMKRYW